MFMNIISTIQNSINENLDVILTKRQVFFILFLSVCILVFVIFYFSFGRVATDDVTRTVTPPDLSAPLFEKK